MQSQRTPPDWLSMHWGTMNRLENRRRLFYQSLEDRRLLAADLEVGIDDYTLESPGDEVTRIIRVYNNGDQPGAIVRSAIGEQLDDATWTREVGWAKVVNVADRSVADADFVISSSLAFQWQPVGDVNHDGFLDYGIWYNDRDTKGWVVFGGRNEVQISKSRPFVADPAPGEGEAISLEITRSEPIRRFDFEALGDVNGDGIDDFSVDGHKILGSQTLPSEIELPIVVRSPVVLPDRFEGFETTVVGDINNDGYVDFGLAQPGSWNEGLRVLLGGPDPVDHNALERVIAPRTNSLVGPTTVYDAGDVNGDGIDDVLVAFKQAVCDCTATDLSFYEFFSGVSVVFGHEGIGQGVTPESLKPVTLLFDRDIRATTTDRNADGVRDLQINENVIFGGEYLREFEGKLFTTDRLQGENGYTQDRNQHATVNIDTNGDGTRDRVVHKRRSLATFLGQGEPSSISDHGISGSGDIDETINLPAGMSAIYTVTGTLRPDAASELVATVATTAEQPETLGDNVYPRALHPVWVEADILSSVHDVPSADGSQSVSVEITLRNQGLETARLVRLNETLSEQLSDVVWTVESQSFPTNLDVRQGGPHEEGVDLHPGQWIHLEVLGQDVGTLGDINGDGSPELFATNTAGLKVYWGGNHFDSTGLVGTLGTTTIPLGRRDRYPRRQHATIKPLGDTDADGFADFLVVDEAFRDEPSRGSIYLGGNRNEFPIEERVVNLNVASLKRHFGDDLRQLALAGDLNGDSHPDYVSDAGILLGTEQGLFQEANGRFRLVADKVLADDMLYPLGDINDDGINDLAVQQAESDIAIILGGSEIQAGELDIQSRSHHTIVGFEILESCPGCGATGGYDTDGDGTNDVILRGKIKDGQSVTEAVLVLSRLEGDRTDATDLPVSAGIQIESTSFDDHALTLSVGDFDGDFRAELVIAESRSAYLFDLEGIGGRMKLSDLLENQAYASQVEVFRDGVWHGDTDAIVGPAIDANGDGIDDFMIGRGPNHFWVSGFSHAKGEAGLVLGRQTIPQLGAGPIGSLPVNIPVGGTVTVRIDGTLAAETVVDGEVGVLTDDDQLHLFVPDVQTVRVGRITQNADLNGNGTVDFADFLILSANFGSKQATAQDGDIDGDGAIDIGDFLLLARRFGKPVV